MTIKEKLTDCTTTLYKRFESMQEEITKLETEIKRIKELDTRLTYRIMEDKITDETKVIKAIELLKTSMDVDEILEEVSK